jgi:uncharacterized protein YndB with AHSA1/START domain
MYTLEHELNIDSTPSAAYEALTTEKGLRSWHTGDATGDGPSGGLWHMGKNSKTPFVWEVIELTPDNVVGWRCQTGPGTSPGTVVHFVIDAKPDGRINVSLIHSGWQSKDGNYRKCNTLWGGLLTHLKRYLETGTRSPMFP